jgi:Amt family ammonium transporter
MIYPIFGHWAWADGEAGSGWLKTMGFIDFAGSTVVHSVGGWVALAAVLLIGPRQGFKKVDFLPSNLSVYTLGVFLLLIGWFGFNGGSVLAFDDSIPKILLNTFLGAAAGGTVMVCYFLKKQAVDVSGTLLGLIAGLVGITAGCHVFSAYDSVIMGAVAAMLAYAADQILKEKGIDDVVSSFPAHAVAGIWGTLGVAIFGELSAFEGLSRWQQFGVQMVGVVSCAIWSFGGAFALLKFLSRWFNPRVSHAEEHIGLNVSEHGAYTQSQKLLDEMKSHSESGLFSASVAENMYTEVGEIAHQYNRVIKKVKQEQDKQKDLLGEIKKQAKENETIITSSREAIVVMDEDHNIILWNPEAENIFQWKRGDVLGKDFYSLVLPELLRTEVWHRFIERVDRGDPNILGVRHELHLNNKTGHAFLAEVILQNLSGVDGHVCAFIQDITDRKKYEESLIKMRDSALSVATMKSEFLATMSHEIRTPLNGILGFSQLLKDTDLEDEQKLYVDTITKSSDNLLKIINSILDYSKVDADKMPIRPTTFSLRTLVQDTVSSFSYQCSQDLQMGSYISKDVKMLVYADQQLLQQVLVNLMGNAIKFTEKGSVMMKVIVLETKEHHQTLRVEVTDTGIGIPMDKQGKLFQSFSQVDSTESRKYGGTGLGLAYCKKVVELMGGQVGFTSEHGKGSTFWFSMEMETEGLPEEEERWPLRGQKLIMAEPNKEMRFLLRSYSEDWGLEAESVLEVNDLKLLLLQNDQIDHLIIDESFGGLDADELSEVLEGLHEQYPSLNLVMSRGHKHKGDLIPQHEKWKTLIKPYAMDDVFQVLKSSESSPFSGEEGDGIVGANGMTGSQSGDAQGRQTFEPKLLYVDDNEDNRVLLATYLKKWGISFDLAENGQEGLDKCKGCLYAAVLMDIQMPVLSGYEAVRILRQDPRYEAHPHIMAVTASKDSDEVDVDLFNGSLEKPMDVAELKAFTKKVLEPLEVKAGT